MDRFFLLQMGADAPSLLPYGTHDPLLVVLSVCLAIFASTMALHATEQARVLTQSRLRSVTLLAGSLALGCGVWGMHFIGMLAFNLCTPITYDPLVTILSALPSIGIFTRKSHASAYSGGRPCASFPVRRKVGAS